jgi:acyl carrier protein
MGELYIGGAGLARGYLNQPDLTEEKFIQNPFQTMEEKNDKSFGAVGKNSRLYKTGDLVRWLPDGNLEYIGRNDFQVKIRGYRIELGEIESILNSFDGIKQSAVIAKEHTHESEAIGSNKYLVGYYLADKKLDEDKILDYLKVRLPEYMVPSALVYLDKLPLTINGKLDRPALPNVEIKTDNQGVKAPRTQVEKEVRKIWVQILNINPLFISTDSNFFDLGGNSLLLIRLKAKIEQHFKHKNLKIIDLFKHTTIKSLSEFLTYDQQIQSPRSNKNITNYPITHRETLKCQIKLKHHKF